MLSSSTALALRCNESDESDAAREIQISVGFRFAARILNPLLLEGCHGGTVGGVVTASEIFG